MADFTKIIQQLAVEDGIKNDLLNAMKSAEEKAAELTSKLSAAEEEFNTLKTSAEEAFTKLKTRESELSETTKNLNRYKGLGDVDKVAESLKQIDTLQKQIEALKTSDAKEEKKMAEEKDTKDVPKEQEEVKTSLDEETSQKLSFLTKQLEEVLGENKKLAKTVGKLTEENAARELAALEAKRNSAIKDQLVALNIDPKKMHMAELLVKDQFAPKVEGDLVVTKNHTLESPQTLEAALKEWSETEEAKWMILAKQSNGGPSPDGKANTPPTNDRSQYFDKRPNGSEELNWLSLSKGLNMQDPTALAIAKERGLDLTNTIPYSPYGQM